MFQAKGAVSTMAGRGRPRIPSGTASSSVRWNQGESQAEAGRAQLPGGLQDQAGGRDRARGVPTESTDIDPHPAGCTHILVVTFGN